MTFCSILLMHIRKFRTQDAHELSKAVQKTLFVSNSGDYSKKSLRFLCNEYTPENLLNHAKRMDIFVAYHNKKLVGTISLTGNRLSRMFVLPQFQRRGMGSKLLRHIEVLAKKRDIKTLRVRSSVTAFDFYKKLGFHKTRRVLHKSIGAVIWMKKEL